MPADIPEKAGGFTYVQSSAPVAPQIGDSWFNPSDGNGKAFFWNGQIWIQLGLEAFT